MMTKRLLKDLNGISEDDKRRKRMKKKRFEEDGNSQMISTRDQELDLIDYRMISSFTHFFPFT